MSVIIDGANGTRFGDYYLKTEFTSSPVATEPIQADGSGGITLNDTGLTVNNTSLGITVNGGSAGGYIRVISSTTDIAGLQLGDTDDFDAGRILYDNATENLLLYSRGLPVLQFGLLRNADIKFKLGVNQDTPLAQLHVNPSASTIVGQIIQLAASQSVNALEIQDSVGGVLTSIDEDGGGSFSGNVSLDNALSYRIKDSGGTAVNTVNLSASNILILGNNTISDVYIRGGDASSTIQLRPNNIIAGQFDNHATAGGTRMKLYDVDTATAQRVKSNGGILTLDNYTTPIFDGAGGVSLSNWTIDGGDGYKGNVIGTAVTSSYFVGTTYMGLGVTTVGKDWRFFVDNSSARGIAIRHTTGNVGIGTVSPISQLSVFSSSSTTIGQVIRLAASQSVNALEIQDSAGTILADFDEDGFLEISQTRNGSVVQATVRNKGTSVNSHASLTLRSTGGANNSYPYTLYLSGSQYFTTGINRYDEWGIMNSSVLSTGSPLAVTATGEVRVGEDVGSTGFTVPSDFYIQSRDAANVPQAIRLAVSQTANAFEVQDSVGGVLASIDAAGGMELSGQAKIESNYTYGDLDTIPLRIIGNGQSGDVSGWPLLELYNPATDDVGQYAGEAKLFVRAGNATIGNQRRYIHFRKHDNSQDDWIWGVNASDVRIEYDTQATVHRSWLIQGDDSDYAAAGTGSIRLNYHPTDTVGTGSFTVHRGGSPTGNKGLMSLALTTLGDADTPLNLFLNGGDVSSQNTYVAFLDRGSQKFFMGKHGTNAFVLYDQAAAKYLMWNTGGNLGLLGASSFGGGTAVIGIKDAAIIPSSDPVGGGIFYVDAGALYYRGSSGTITHIAAA